MILLFYSLGHRENEICRPSTQVFWRKIHILQAFNNCGQSSNGDGRPSGMTAQAFRAVQQKL
jgi:hypothetical protein